MTVYFTLYLYHLSSHFDAIFKFLIKNKIWFLSVFNIIVYLNFLTDFFLMLFHSEDFDPCWWIPRLIAQFEKKLFGIPDFFIAFGFPIDANIMDIFGIGRGPPRWPQGTVNFLLFFKICWRCPTLEDHTSRSGRAIWARVCLLERSNSLLLGKNMKFGIYRLSPILGQWQCSMSYNSRRPSSSEAGLWGL